MNNRWKNQIYFHLLKVSRADPKMQFYATFVQAIQIKKRIFAFVILIGNFSHTGKRLALFLTDESGQFVVTGIMFNRLCLAISGFAHAIAKREQLNLIRHARPSRADQ